MGLLSNLVFVGFFLATLVAIFYHRNRYVRTTYIAGFVGTLLALNLFLTANVLPLVHWHKFSSPQEQSQTVYQFRLVDTQGNELRPLFRRRVYTRLAH
jgi:cytochrome c biogenesis protein CcdA